MIGLAFELVIVAKLDDVALAFIGIAPAAQSFRMHWQEELVRGSQADGVVIHRGFNR